MFGNFCGLVGKKSEEKGGTENIAACHQVGREPFFLASRVCWGIKSTTKITSKISGANFLSHRKCEKKQKLFCKTEKVV